MQRYYLYQCSASTESRGRREDHDKGCGRWAVRASNINLNDPKTPSIQSRPCKNPDCKKRQRLSKKNVWEAPVEKGWECAANGTPIFPDYEGRKTWAYQEMKERNGMLSTSEESTQKKVSTSSEKVSTSSSEVSA